MTLSSCFERLLTGVLTLLLILILGSVHISRGMIGIANARGAEPGAGIPGAEVITFENIEGLILVPASLIGVRDTSGLLVLDTGAGYLALDHPVAERLGLLDDRFVPGSVDFADKNLSRLRLGSLEIDQVAPVLVLDASVVRRVTDRPALGLLGESVLRGRVVFIDYRAERITFLPAGVENEQPRDRARPSHDDDHAVFERSRRSFKGLLTDRARPLRFRLAGDGKMIVRGRFSMSGSPPWSDTLNLILDTGATKCVFFESRLERRVPQWARWPNLAGLSAPTLLGNSAARLVRMPTLELIGDAEDQEGSDRAVDDRAVERNPKGSNTTTSHDRRNDPRSAHTGNIARADVDAAVIESPLSDALERVAGMPIDGLIGYSYLRRYRIGIDDARHVAWFDPLPEPWDDRPFEYSHVGIQIERNGSAAEIVAIAGGSPASRAAISVGDTLVAVDGAPAAEVDLETLARKLEGPPGTAVDVTLRQGGRETSRRLVRRRLL